MDDHAPLGPSGRVESEGGQAGNGSERSLPALVLPDAANDGLTAADLQPVFYCLSKRPLLVRDARGNPVFSLTIMLSRAPGPEDTNVRPLIRQSVVQMEVALALPQGALAEMSGAGRGDYRALFLRSADYNWAGVREGAPGKPIASAHTDADDGRAAVSAHLDRAETLDLLAALEGGKSQMELRAEASFRAAAVEQATRLRGVWASIYDFLQERQGADGEFTRAGLREQFGALLTSNLLTVYEVSAASGERPLQQPETDALFDLFMRISSVILERSTPELESADPENRYRLRGRPHPVFNLDYEQKMSGSGYKSVRLSAPLEEVLGGALKGLDPDAFIHLVAPGEGDGGGGGWQPVPPRSRTNEPSPGRRNSRGATDAPLKMAALGGEVQSISYALKPSAQAPVAAASLSASHAVLAGGARHWWTDDLVLERPQNPRLRSLPVVEDPTQNVWPDRLDRSKLWYAPSFELVRPALNADPSSSPFFFGYEIGGTTADGKRALNGTLRFTLRVVMSRETRRALQDRGLPNWQPLEVQNLAVTLDVPFVDPADNQTKSYTFAAEVRRVGDRIVATVRMLNDWVKLTYGALSLANFQSRPALVRVSYAYEAYFPVKSDEMEVVYGGKTALTPIVYSDDVRLAAGTLHFAAHHATLRASGAEFVLRREAARDFSAQPLAGKAAPAFASLAASPAGVSVANPARPTAAAGVSRPTTVGEAVVASHRQPVKGVLVPTIAAKPPLKETIVSGELLRKRQYATRMFARQEQETVFFSCSDYGAFYVETDANGTRRALGCRDASELGRQATYRLYEELPALAHELYRVYRSLQQPGRFMVVPSAYRITRKEPTDTDAYRPCAVVYAEINVTPGASPRYIFQATMLPDIPPYARRELLSKLSAFAASPAVEYPTDVPCEVAYNWALSGLVTEHSAVRMPGTLFTPGAFVVGLVTDLYNGQLLMAILRREGVRLSADFRLPDGSQFFTNLTLQLANMTGPWTGGPVSLNVSGRTVGMTNRIEHEVTVSELRTYQSAAAVARVPVEARLGPGAVRPVELPGAAAEVYAAYRVTTAAEVALDEVRIFSEDIKTNVLFVNQINYANHGLKTLAVQARLEGVAGTFPVLWRTAEAGAQPSAGDVEFTLPITTYLAQRVLQFQVTKTFTSGQVSPGPWRNWDLSVSNVVSLTWETI